MSINQRFKKTLQELNIDIDELSIKIGVSKQSLYNIINEKHVPKASILESFFKVYLKVNPAWLMTGLGEMILTDQPKDSRYIEQRIEDVEEKIKLVLSKISIDEPDEADKVFAKSKPVKPKEKAR